MVDGRVAVGLRGASVLGDVGGASVVDNLGEGFGVSVMIGFGV